MARRKKRRTAHFEEGIAHADRKKVGWVVPSRKINAILFLLIRLKLGLVASSVLKLCATDPHRTALDLT